ncbi:hypothetical protein [Colwellia sp. BRX10-3]|nr:hypothetical protein [Colwellia sp. BRX10-3]
MSNLSVGTPEQFGEPNYMPTKRVCDCQEYLLQTIGAGPIGAR